MHNSAGDLSSLLDADLANAGYSGSLEPFPGQSPRDFAMMSLRKSLLKKFHNNELPESANDKAREKFLQKNSECAMWVYPTLLSEADAIVLGEAESFLWTVCNPFGGSETFSRPNYHWSCGEYDVRQPLLSLGNIEAHCDFGPGANIGARSGDPYGKLAITELTYTDPALLVLFQQSCRSYPLWNEQEQFRSQRWGAKQVKGSRLSFVSKTTEISRSICTEPILNMFFQKGIGRVLERRLLQVTGIDLKIQPQKNQALARIGSEDGSYGTIDLSSASDSMSLPLVRRFFPKQFVSWLEMTRSPYTRLDTGEEVELHMVSSMGNAFTFPLQTLFFTSLVVGAYKVLGIPIQFPKGDRLGNFAVYGDDIIVRKEAYGLLVRALIHCGFAVNHDKSFNEGNFRESCGHDYYRGHNVRGVYLEKLLDDLDCYSAANRLYRWSAFHDIYLWNVFWYLHKRVKRQLFVPLDEDDEAGFKVPWSVAKDVIRIHERSKNFHYVKGERSKLVLRLPENALDEKAVERLRVAITGWEYNPAGLVLLCLRGNVRDGRLSLRIQRSRARYKKRHSPRWDYGVFDGPEMAHIRERYFSALSLAWYGEVTRA